MTFLLDTHVLLWLLTADPALPARHRHAIENATGVVYGSAVSVAELAIKASLGKLPAAPERLDDWAERGLTELPLRAAHAARLRDLPFIHRDPFDRMLIAQAQADGLTLMTVDETVMRYDVSVLGP